MLPLRAMHVYVCIYGMQHSKVTLANVAATFALLHAVAPAKPGWQWISYISRLATYGTASKGKILAANPFSNTSFKFF